MGSNRKGGETTERERKTKFIKEDLSEPFRTKPKSQPKPTATTTAVSVQPTANLVAAPASSSSSSSSSSSASSSPVTILFTCTVNAFDVTNLTATPFLLVLNSFDLFTRLPPHQLLTPLLLSLCCFLIPLLSFPFFHFLFQSQSKFTFFQISFSPFLIQLPISCIRYSLQKEKRERIYVDGLDW